MKKEEFITKLKKSLSVLEEKEIQDIIEEYEQHIDMKMKGGLSEEDAIHDFGDLKELTAGILEAYHVKANYHAEKNIDFEKVKAESRKATEKATNVIGKGADALGKGAGAAGKWGLQGIKKLWSVIKKPFTGIRKKLYGSREKAQKYGIFGKLWMIVLGGCSLIWHFIAWCVRLCWNVFWMMMGTVSGLCTLGCVFWFGVMVVLLIMGYPLAGMTMITIGAGLTSGAFCLICFSLFKKSDKGDGGIVKKDLDTGDSDMEDADELQKNWECPKEDASKEKKITVINSCEEVLKHA